MIIICFLQCLTKFTSNGNYCNYCCCPIFSVSWNLGVLDEMNQTILWILLTIFIFVFIWSFKQYRIIKRIQYLDDEHFALIILGETNYETCICNKNKPDIFVLRQKHKSFRGAKRRYEKLIKECRYLNQMRLKELPKGAK